MPQFVEKCALTRLNNRERREGAEIPPRRTAWGRELETLLMCGLLSGPPCTEDLVNPVFVVGQDRGGSSQAFRLPAWQGRPQRYWHTNHPQIACGGHASPSPANRALKSETATHWPVLLANCSGPLAGSRLSGVPLAWRGSEVPFASRGSRFLGISFSDTML